MIRIAMYSPVLGDAFGQERVMVDSGALLEGVGHEVFYLGERWGAGSWRGSEKSFLVPEVSSLQFLSRPLVVRERLSLLLGRLRALRVDVVHLIDQVDFRVMNALLGEFRVVLTSHTFATSCPSSTRLIRPEGFCEKASGYSCLWYERGYDCLSHLRGELRKIHSVSNFILRQRALKKFPMVFAISRVIRESLVKDGFDPSRIRLVSNPVKVPAVGARSRLKLLDPPLLLTASRLEPHKGMSWLFESLSEIKEKPWQLWVCGEGSQLEALQNQTLRLGLENRIFFKGRVSHDEIQQSLRKATCLIQPNLGPEPFGLSVAEASALGVPVIAGDIPALNEIIDPGKTGLLVPLGNREALANAISTLLDDVNLQAVMEVEGPLRIQRLYSPEQHLKSTLDAYEELMLQGQEHFESTAAAFLGSDSDLSTHRLD